MYLVVKYRATRPSGLTLRVMISFPSASVAPSVHTSFVDGVKFDICEVDKCAYDMLNDKRFRYFLCVEDTTIVGFASAEKFCNATGEDRWDMFCKSMADCKALIKKFEDAHESILKLQERAKKSKSLEISCTAKIQDIKKTCIDTFGIYPTF